MKVRQEGLRGSVAGRCVAAASVASVSDARPCPHADEQME